MTAPDAPCPPADRPDWYLLSLIQGGDRAAAGELYARYVVRLRAVAAGNAAGRADPDDAVQSAFRSFLTAAGRGLYHVPDGRDLWALLVVTVLNKLRSYARRAAAGGRTRTAAPDALAETPAPRGDDPALAVATRELIDGLPPLERRVTELRLAGHSVDEIARHLGRSRRTVERNLQSCRDRLKDEGLRHE